MSELLYNLWNFFQHFLTKIKQKITKMRGIIMQENKTIVNERNQSLMRQFVDDINVINQTGFSYTIVDENETSLSFYNNLEEIIVKKLNEVGMPPSLKGYRYIITAVKEVLNNENILDGVTKILYPKVARVHKCTPQRVEKGIRYAIELAWSRNNGSKLKEEFSYIMAPMQKRPTNSEFIAMLSQHIKIMNWKV